MEKKGKKESVCFVPVCMPVYKHVRMCYQKKKRTEKKKNERVKKVEKKEKKEKNDKKR